MRTLLAALALGTLWGGQALAHEFKAGSITVEHPWARPAASGNGAVYLGVTNEGSAADRLVAVSSAAAATAELHATTIDAQGIASMRPVQAVDIPVGGEAKLGPGGVHVMLIGLKQPLAVGQSFPLTLTFERAGPVAVEVAVERTPSHGGEAGGHHGSAPSN